MQNADTIADTATNLTKFGGVGTAIFAGLTAQEVAAIGGLTVTLLAFIVSLWYQHKRLVLQREALRKEQAAREEHLQIARDRRADEIHERDTDTP